MNSKKMMLEVLNKKVNTTVPVTPHWWGLYKFQLGGLINSYENQRLAWESNLEQVLKYDELFYNTFEPDMLHLTSMAGKKLDMPELNELLALRKEASPINNMAKIDRYINFLYRTTEDILAAGEFEHVKRHSQKFGDEVLIALNEGSDTAWFFDTHVGFENGLIGLLENSELVQYYLERLYDNTLERMKAYKINGGHAFINSETYCGADIISPVTYRDVIFPVHKAFYKKLKGMGIIPICYFTGNVLPILDYIKQLDINGLMVEASKKNFIVDIGEIADALEGTLTLFGNLESHYILERGTKEEVKKETLRQLKKTKGKPFIMANDCPISFNTPVENIATMIRTVREYSPNGPTNLS